METVSALLAICAGNSLVSGESPHKGQWRGALTFSLIWAWINRWVNNRKAGELRRHHGHYDVIVMRYLHGVHCYIFGVKDMAANYEYFTVLNQSDTCTDNAMLCESVVSFHTPVYGSSQTMAGVIPVCQPHRVGGITGWYQMSTLLQTTENCVFWLESQWHSCIM